MSQDPIIQLGGLNAATAHWLRSESSAEAVKVCTQLITKQDWNLLQNPSGNEEPALILHGGKKGIILLSTDELSPSRVAADHEHWTSLLKELPKSWKEVTLLYLTGQLPDESTAKQIESATSKNFLGKKLSAAALASEGDHLGPLPKVIQGLKPASLDTDIATLFTAIRDQGVEFHNFIDRLNSTKSWGTYTLIAFCVATFAWGTAAGGTENLWLLLRFGANFKPLTIEAGQWWRLLGSSFLHIGVVHLLVNMYSLKIVGETLEKFLGNTQYLTLYGVAALFGSLASAFTGDDRVSAGASGAIFGLIGACVVLGYRYKDDIPRPMRQSMINGMLPALGYNLIFGFSVSGIDNSAHLGGLLAGAVTAWVIPPNVVKPNLSRPLQAVLASLAASLFLLQFFTLYQSYRGLDLKNLPSRQETFGSWSIPIPDLFQAAETPGTFKGPGVIVICSAVEWQPESGELNDENLKKLIEEQSQLSFSSSSKKSVDGREWLVLNADDEISRRIAVKFEGNQIILVGVMAQLDSEMAISQVLDFLMHATTFTS